MWTPASQKSASSLGLKLEVTTAIYGHRAPCLLRSPSSSPSVGRFQVPTSSPVNQSEQRATGKSAKMKRQATAEGSWRQWSQLLSRILTAGRSRVETQTPTEKNVTWQN